LKGKNVLRKSLKKLRRMGRALSRKVKGSANRRKAAAKLVRLHARIANIRQDALHKATIAIVSKFSIIGIEDLNVRGMMRTDDWPAQLPTSAPSNSGGSWNTRHRSAALGLALRIAGSRRARRARIVDTSTPI
jgi:transposase